MNREAPTRRAVLSWALYDWANSSFATTVMAGFFPLLFKDYWCRGLAATASTFWLGVTVSLSSLVVALVAPVLGAMADRGGTRKRALALFAALGVAGTAGLFFVAEGHWRLAAGCYALATVGFLCSLVFYDALLVSVSTAATVDRVSSLGYSLGYLGGGLLFLLNVVMVEQPAWFGLASGTQAARVAFVSVAVWWAAFSVPLFRFVPEARSGPRLSPRQAARDGFAQVRRTMRDVRRTRPVLLLLLAYWFYIDGVDTIIAMAVDYGKSVGFGTGELIKALLIVQFLGFPFAWLAGWVATRWGTQRTILACLATYVLISFTAGGISLAPWHVGRLAVSKFYTVTVLIAAVQGGTQALSRALYSRLVPPERAAEFFGFYNMVGKFAAILGPLLMGSVTRLTGDPRAGIRSVAILFIVGAVLLLRVKIPPQRLPGVAAGDGR